MMSSHSKLVISDWKKNHVLLKFLKTVTENFEVLKLILGLAKLVEFVSTFVFFFLRQNGCNAKFNQEMKWYSSDPSESVSCLFSLFSYLD